MDGRCVDKQTPPSEAGHHALGSLNDGFARAQADYEQGWTNWNGSLLPQGADDLISSRPDLLRTSATVLRAHESKDLPEVMVASLSISMGMTKGDDNLGGYHIVWPRVMVESADALLATGARENARRVLGYLKVIQEADGHRAQRMWLAGSTYWHGVQMDETALPHHPRQPRRALRHAERGVAEKLLAEPDPQAQNASP
jgi:glucoamylase